jgi:hypothetical protein
MCAVSTKSSDTKTCFANATTKCTLESLACDVHMNVAHCGCLNIEGALEHIDITTTPSPTSTPVTHISMEGNRITSLGPDWLQGGDSVQAVDLSSNKLPTIQSTTFNNLKPTLKQLDYSGNMLERIGKGVFNCSTYFPALQEVNVAANDNLVYIHEQAVANCDNFTLFEQGDVPKTCPADSTMLNVYTGDKRVPVRVCKGNAGVQCLVDQVERWSSA